MVINFRNATKKAELEACVALADKFKSGDNRIAHWQIRICEEKEGVRTNRYHRMWKSVKGIFLPGFLRILIDFASCTGASKSIDAACICIEAINATEVEEMQVTVFLFCICVLICICADLYLYHLHRSNQRHWSGRDAGEHRRYLC